eukprot:CAMPEP_0185210130 /NCGR_PEP_ID=MMETSP1140-20130426/65045_1 /TAXON_ID=298111 /ORGANISM="Pavlova sp., Strain CCMP459" /LENGTH=48 /DNA_ID= /DNA_START= /DNA_END= /DNA_ORIENTATION=
MRANPAAGNLAIRASRIQWSLLRIGHCASNGDPMMRIAAVVSDVTDSP